MSATGPSTSPRHARRGNASIEFALVAPVVVTLLGGVVEWGQFTTQELAVIHAVREGARLGAAEGGALIEEGSNAELAALVESRVQSVLVDMGQDGDAANVNTAVDLFEGHNLITVSCSLDYAPVFSLVPSPGSLSSELTMLVEE